MLTIEGLRINTTIEALASGEGFIVRVNTSWNLDRDQRDAQRQAQDQDLLGQIHNGHEATYADAETKLTQVTNQFETDITNFITNYNSEQTTN